MASTLRADQSLARHREQAVAEAVGKIRDIEKRRGVTRQSLESIKNVLIDLSKQKELFSRDHYPTPESGSALWLLSEDPDQRFALYISTGQPGRATPPHNHTTWAVIVGLAGEEENNVYQRIDDGSVPGKGEVGLIRTFVIHEGEGAAYMPDDIHSIRVLGNQPTHHFHMYGMSLENLPGRLQFDMENGTCKVFPPNPTIRK